MLSYSSLRLSLIIVRMYAASPSCVWQQTEKTNNDNYVHFKRDDYDGGETWSYPKKVLDRPFSIPAVNCSEAHAQEMPPLV